MKLLRLLFLSVAPGVTILFSGLLLLHYMRPTGNERGLQTCFKQWTLVFQRNLEHTLDNVSAYRVGKVEGTYRLSDRDVIRAARLEQQPHLWELAPSEIYDAIQSLPWVESFTVNWNIFPLRLDVSIKEADPWLVAEYDGDSWLVSRKNELIVPLDSLSQADFVLEAGSLPRLGGLEARTKLSSYLSSKNARLHYATKMISFLEMSNSLPFSVERYELQNDGSLLVLAQQAAQYPSVRLRVTSLDEANETIERLSSILNDLRQRNERVATIDLRFANQAVVQ